jgi:hypothetical protein
MSHMLWTRPRRCAVLPLIALMSAFGLMEPARAGVTATGTVRERPAPRVAAVFDPAARETRVTGRVEGMCVALSLPHLWTLNPDAANPDAALSAHLQAADGPALDLTLRSARSLPPVPTLASRQGPIAAASDALARRAAGALQREHESFLGRAAQSVSLTALGAGALRWTATWIDPQLAASGALTVDAALLPLSPDWVLEVTLSGTEDPALHDVVLGEVLERVRVGRSC